MRLSESIRLTLVGTVHRDIRGTERLLSLLRTLRPDIITLEMSEWALKYRRGEALVQLKRLDHLLDLLAADLLRNRQELDRHPTVADIRLLLELPFEYQAVSIYSREKGIPLHLIDRSDISAAKLRKVSTELITYSNLKVLVTIPSGEERSAAETIRVARRLVRDEADAVLCRAFLRARRGKKEIGPRDRHMAGKIRGLIKGNPGRHLVHIGGWVHLVEDEQGETLFSLMADLEPRRMLLTQ